ncbi:MAG: LacI family transcriptional regulator [Proteobacteria bacterium]|nr:LacI family transcriptional regulator [Pseudomonadota bacterium]
MVTMLDISLRAGMSKATVFPGAGHVKERTRAQVFKAMEELGERSLASPSRSVRLGGGRTVSGLELLQRQQFVDSLTTADQTRNTMIKQHFRQQRAAVVV